MNINANFKALGKDISFEFLFIPAGYDINQYLIDYNNRDSHLRAGIVGLLNSFQRGRGKSRLGYLNPLLYTMAQNQSSTFNDIISGNNSCTEYNCCPQRPDGGSDYGYLATKGWDPVSGWGTPNVGEIFNWLLSNT